MSSELDELAIIELDGSAISELSPFQLRLLRIFARRLEGFRVSVKLLGGLSGATVVRAEVFSPAGQRLAAVVAKIDSVEAVRKEIERYKRWVGPLLRVGDLTHLVAELASRQENSRLR